MRIEEDDGLRQSQASFLELRKECFKLSKGYFNISALAFPNISILADEHEKSLEHLDLKDYALSVGKDNKIEFVREARRRHNLSLIDAKILQEGMWRRLGWDESPSPISGPLSKQCLSHGEEYKKI